MLAISFVSMWLAIAPQTAGADGRASTFTPADLPSLEITARLVRPDGQTGTASKSGTEKFDGFVWTDQQCGLAASDHDASRAMAGWRFSARVTSVGSNVRNVQIEWQRAWESNRQVTGGQANTIDRTMRAGERIEIDRIDLGAAAGSCSGAQLRFEATLYSPMSVGARGAAMGMGGRGAGTGAGGMGAGGARGGRGGGVQGGVAAGVPGGVAGGVAAGRGGGRGAGVQTFSADLWLVHTVPNGPADTANASNAARLDRMSFANAVVAGRGGRGGGAGFGSTNPPSEAGPNEREEVVHQYVRFEASGSGFTFPALSIGTSRGPIGVIVTGTISARIENGAPTKLVVSINRQAVSMDASVSPSSGNSTKEIAWPGTGDVISFVLPAPASAGQDPIAGEKIAIRMRLGSATGMARGGGHQ